MSDMLHEAEEWRAVAGFEGRYEISNHGRIRGLVNNKGKPHKEPRILSPGYGGMRTRYDRIALYRVENGKRRRVGRYIHVMVLEAFEGPRPGPEYHASHEDDDSSNNHIRNLMWRPGLDNILKANYRRWSYVDVMMGTPIEDDADAECPF